METTETIEETSDDKFDMVIKRLEALKKGIGKGRGKHWYNYDGHENKFPTNRQQDKKDEQVTDKSESTHVKEPLNG